jgi:Putative lumazine-binding
MLTSSTLMLAATIAAAPPAILDEDQAIRAAALDYIEGFYIADAGRMERALHPELVKRIFRKDGDSTRLDTMSALTLINRTKAGNGLGDKQRRTDIRVLDRFQNSATVRIDATRWVDYLQLAKVDGEWRIVNVLWELRDEQ